MSKDYKIADDIYYLQQSISFTTRLRALREQHGFTQTEIAKIIGISLKKYSYYELAQLRVPYEFLLAVSDIFDVSLDYLFGRTDVQGRYPAASEGTRTELPPITPVSTDKIQSTLQYLTDTLASLQSEQTQKIEGLIKEVSSIENRLKKVSP